MRILAIVAALTLLPACTQNTRNALQQQNQADGGMDTQGGMAQQQQEGTGGTGQQQGATMGQAGATQQIQGQVVAVNPNAGTITIASNGTNYTLRGTPSQLQSYQQGQNVTLQYQNFGNSSWVASQGQQQGMGGQGQQQGTGGTGEQGMNQQQGTGGTGQQGMNQQGGSQQTQTFSGTVTQVNPSQGTIVVANRTFNAYPGLLQGVSQGQQVTVAFRSYNGNVWVESLQGQGGMQQGTGGSGQQGQMGGMQQGGQGGCEPQGGMQQGTGGSGQQGQMGGMQGGMQQGQMGGMQGGMQQGQMGGMQGGMQQGATQQIQGQVVAINPNQGTMTVTSAGRTISVRGTPNQLQQYSRGQQVTLQYRTYGNNVWLEGGGVGGSGTGQTTGQRFTGTVAQVNPSQGTLVIGNRTFYAHPSQLQQLSQGQQVTVTYATYGNNLWLQSVQPGMGGGSGTGGTGGNGYNQ